MGNNNEDYFSAVNEINNILKLESCEFCNSSVNVTIEPFPNDKALFWCCPECRNQTDIMRQFEEFIDAQK